MLLLKLVQAELFDQFINYFYEKHPQSTLKMFVYHSGNDYINVINNNAAHVADMVLAIDLTVGDQSIPAIKDCFKVCNAVTKHNKNAQHLISNSGFGNMNILHTHKPTNMTGYLYVPQSSNDNYLEQDYYCKGYGMAYWPIKDKNKKPLTPFLNDLYYQGFYVKSLEKAKKKTEERNANYELLLNMEIRSKL